VADFEIENRTLTQQIQDHLMDLIAEGVIERGHPLRVEALCQQYGYTHTPLREALSSLTSHGLLDYSPNRGYRVRELTDGELHDIYEVREALEGQAARLLAGCITPPQLAELRTVAGECERLLKKSPDSTELITADLKFHRLIAEWCGNLFIPRLLLGPNILRQGSALLRGRQYSAAARSVSHTDIVEAIDSGEGDRAEKAMREHIRGNIEWLAQSAAG
jgi:DNA-binding GntR family transcriptional regulator